MCDYSLGACKTRDAAVGNELISGSILSAYRQQSMTRGFHAANAPDVAVCLRPGTELAFDGPVKTDGNTWWPFSANEWPHTTAIFREVGIDRPMQHHDTLEFPDGTSVLVTRLAPGQKCRVLQLGVDPKVAHAEGQARQGDGLLAPDVSFVRAALNEVDNAARELAVSTQTKG
jgi:hypothetical protein